MSTSEALFEQALQVIPGGVNSPVRSFKHVGGIPFFTQRAEGAYLITVEGKQLIDYVGNWGAALHGHNHPAIKESIRQALENGTSFGTPNPYEVELAQLICACVPSVQKVRMCSSGTEATLTAIRLARGFTQRDKILKFKGCYHGHVDALLAKAGSGALTLATPDSAGVPPSVTQDTLLLDFNDFSAVEAAFYTHGATLAAVIVEPYLGNCGLIVPKPGYLETLRRLCTQYGALLILDEVMTGFRISLAGVQGTKDIFADLTTFAKVIGGGLPVGALGGRADVMDHLAPLGPVYQAGTLSGNPLAMAAGITAVKLLREKAFYEKLEHTTQALKQHVLQAAQRLGLPIQIPQAGSMLSLFFSQYAVTNYEEALATQAHLFKKLFHYALNNGVFLPPSPYESWFVSAAHGPSVIEQTAEVLAAGLTSL